MQAAENRGTAGGHAGYEQHDSQRRRGVFGVDLGDGIRRKERERGS